MNRRTRPMTLLFLVAALAVFLPGLVHASQQRVGPQAGQVVTSAGVARVMLPDAPAPLTVEWGPAPLAGNVLQVPAGARVVELPGVQPGGVYVVRVFSRGRLVTRPTPFVMPGAPARVPGISKTSSM